MEMSHKIFFVFDYEQDLYRVLPLCRIRAMEPVTIAGLENRRQWRIAKRGGDNTVHRLIDDAIDSASLTVVCVGNRTYRLEHVWYAIQQSVKRQKGLLGIQIHQFPDEAGLSTTPGRIPDAIENPGFRAYNYVNDSHFLWAIEEALCHAQVRGYSANQPLIIRTARSNLISA